MIINSCCCCMITSMAATTVPITDIHSAEERAAKINSTSDSGAPHWQMRTLCSCFFKLTDLITGPLRVKQGSAPTAICPASIDESVHHNRRGRFNIPPYRRHVGIQMPPWSFVSRWGQKSAQRPQKTQRNPEHYLKKNEQKPGLGLKTELCYRPLKRLQPAPMLRWYADDFGKYR